jgi:hypothetical protein
MKLIFRVLTIIVASGFAPDSLFAQWVQTAGPTGGFVTSLAVSGANLFAGTSGGGVFLSTNSGTNWTAVNTGLTDTLVKSLALSGTNLFAGTEGGRVFLSTDNGTQWTAVDTGLASFAVNVLAVSGGNLFAGTDGSSAWKRPLKEMTTSVAGSDGVQSRFHLEQNYPNPFNPLTVVRYQLSVVSFVNLTVYDLLGRQVAVLVNDMKQAGAYGVPFDGSALASGAYFYRLKTTSHAETKKMILLR